jgi:hypothetical protein
MQQSIHRMNQSKLEQWERQQNDEEEANGRNVQEVR